MTIEKLNILAIIAHPDDLSFFSAGSLAKWAEEGHNVYVLCCTNGEVGTLRTDLSKADVAKKREQELKSSNSLLRFKETIILDYPDAGFIDGAQLRKELVYYVRKYKANRVITFDPWAKYEVHPDHVVVGRMACEAGAFSAFPLLYEDQFQDGITAHSCDEVWLMGLLGHYPNAFVDIGSTLDKKVDAALKFEATLELLANLFAPNINPSNVSPKEMKKLTRHATSLLRSIANVIGKQVELDAAEAFYVQKTLPGHFDNFQIMMSEMLGNPSEKPRIY
jgi:LmbE family N-acetylglucosaminyl deacetylase